MIEIPSFVAIERVWKIKWASSHISSARISATHQFAASIISINRGVDKVHSNRAARPNESVWATASVNCQSSVLLFTLPTNSGELQFIGLKTKSALLRPCFYAQFSRLIILLTYLVECQI